jgi:hypothetical protein
MDTSLIKPTARTARTGFPASRANLGRGTAPTELPSSQSVATTSDATSGRRDGAMHDEHGQAAAGEILMDPEIREIICRAASPGPDRSPIKDAALQLRAYRRAESDHEPETHSVERTV